MFSSNLAGIFFDIFVLIFGKPYQVLFLCESLNIPSSVICLSRLQLHRARNILNNFTRQQIIDKVSKSLFFPFVLLLNIGQHFYSQKSTNGLFQVSLLLQHFGLSLNGLSTFSKFGNCLNKMSFSLIQKKEINLYKLSLPTKLLSDTSSTSFNSCKLSDLLSQGRFLFNPLLPEINPLQTNLDQLISIFWIDNFSQCIY